MQAEMEKMQMEMAVEVKKLEVDSDEDGGTERHGT